MSIEKIFLVHHTHYDIGFTDLAEEVRMQQLRHLDDVIIFCENDPDYRWTIESGTLLRMYIENRSPKQSARMINLLRSGKVELQAFDMQMLTETASFPELSANIARPVELGRRYGFPVECAMLNDIGGLAGGFPCIMNEYKIRYLTWGVGACQAELPWASLPHLFYLNSKNGGRILVWNLGIDRTEKSTESKYPYAVYGLGANYLIYRGCLEYLNLYDMGIEWKMPDEPDEHPLSAQEIFHVLEQRLEREKYPFQELMLQYGGDNRGPAPFLPSLVKELNKSGKFPRIELTTPSVFFHCMEAKYGSGLPERQGLLTDPWNLRINAVPSVLKRYRAAQRLYTAALFRGENDTTLLESMMLSADHTFGLNNWGWHTQYSHPHGGLRAKTYDRVRESWKCKEYYAEDAFRRAQAIDRRTKGMLTSGLQKQVVVWNNAVHEVSGPAELYMGSHAPDIVSLKDCSGGSILFQRAGQNRYWIWAEKVQALGSKSLIPEFSHTWNSPIAASPRKLPQKIETPFLEFEFQQDGSLRKIKRPDGKLLAVNRPYDIGSILCETIRNYPMYNEYCGLLPITDRKVEAGNGLTGELTEDGPLYLTVTQTGKFTNARFEQKIRIWKSLPRIDFLIRLDKKETVEKENYYIAFPFTGKKGTFRFDSNVGYNELQELLPGAALDLFFCAHWASIETKDFTAVLCCPDSPIVEFGGIHTAKWNHQLPLEPESNHIYGLICNNVGNTDSPAWFSVLDTFSYSMFLTEKKFDAAQAQICYESVEALNTDYQHVPIQSPSTILPAKIRVHIDHSEVLYLENLSSNIQKYSFHFRGKNVSGKLQGFELRRM